jgi:hypothetical protein
LTHFDFGYSNAPEWDVAPVPTIGSNVWNFLYALTINVIMTAIISGIIIDTFGERREKKQAIRDDTNNKCFICNINREEFDRAGEDFTFHIQEEHNIYNYFFYFIALKKMSPSQKNNIDDYVIENLNQKKIDMMPIKRVNKNKKKDIKKNNKYKIKFIYKLNEYLL